MKSCEVVEFFLSKNGLGEIFPKMDGSGQIIATSAEVTLNCGLVRESPQNPLNSGLGIILICPEWFISWKNPIKMDDLGGFSPIFGNTHILVN